MKEYEIQKLIDQCIAFFQQNNYTRNRICVYKALWRRGIVKFMEERGLRMYTEAVGTQFVEICHYNGTTRHQEREKIRSVQVLDDMLTRGEIRKRCFTPVVHRLDGELGQEMEKLIPHLTNLRRSDTTIKDYRLLIPETMDES